MCEQCVAGTEKYGEVVSGFHLVRATRDGNEMKQGQYGLLRINNPDFIFDEYSFRPEPDDTGYLAYGRDVELFREDLESNNVSFRVIHQLIQGCIDAGWDTDDYYEEWLFSRIGEVIAAGILHQAEPWPINR